jgi:hypothetical protein
MIDDFKEQEGVHGICGLGTCRDRALIGFITTYKKAGIPKRRASHTRPHELWVENSAFF